MTTPPSSPGEPDEATVERVIKQTCSGLGVPLRPCEYPACHATGHRYCGSADKSLKIIAALTPSASQAREAVIEECAQWHDKQRSAWIDQARNAQRLAQSGDEAEAQEYRQQHERYAAYAIIHRQSAEEFRRSLASSPPAPDTHSESGERAKPSSKGFAKERAKPDAGDLDRAEALWTIVRQFVATPYCMTPYRDEVFEPIVAALAEARRAGESASPPEDPTTLMLEAGIRMDETPRSGTPETLMHDIWQAMYDAWQSEMMSPDGGRRDVS